MPDDTRELLADMLMLIGKGPDRRLTDVIAVLETIFVEILSTLPQAAREHYAEAWAARSRLQIARADAMAAERKAQTRPH